MKHDGLGRSLGKQLGASGPPVLQISKKHVGESNLQVWSHSSCNFT
jgi:hypothetical protein